MKNKNADRRSFLKNAALLGISVPASLALSNNASASEPFPVDTSNGDNKIIQKKNEFSVFITTDLHAQIHTHDEFFWENNEAVYRKRGGLAVLKTMIDSLRKQYPNHILYDGGDYFHGHAIDKVS